MSASRQTADSERISPSPARTEQIASSSWLISSDSDFSLPHFHLFSLHHLHYHHSHLPPLLYVSFQANNLPVPQISPFMDFYSPTGKERAIAVDICPSVHQTRALWRNKIILCQNINAIQYMDSSSIFRPNFVVQSLGVQPDRYVKDRYPLSKAQIWPIICNNLEMVPEYVS